MFYLIETKDQLNKLKSKFNDTMYLEFIQGNDNTHPLLAEIIAVYLNVDNKGYIIPFNHLECINWDKNVILSILTKTMFRAILTFSPLLIAASWALYNIFFLIKKSIPKS